MYDNDVNGGMMDEDTADSVPGETDNGGGAEEGGDRNRTNLSSESSLGDVTCNSCN